MPKTSTAKKPAARNVPTAEDLGRQLAADRRANPAPRSFTLARVKDTANYAKFEAPAPARGSGVVATFGAVYVPLAEADGVKALTVIVNR